MSRLDELIAELCPDGVEYKRFDEMCSLHARVGWQRLTKAEHQNNGSYLLITGTDFTVTNEVNYDSCVYVSEERYLQDPHIQIKNGDILITKDGTLGKVAQVNHLPMPATLNGGIFVVRSKDGLLYDRFVLHFLLSKHFTDAVDRQKTGSTISHLTQALFSRLRIPVPPLEVQREIVRILDSFTEITNELTGKLTAELTARKKQYEYYMKDLLSFYDNVTWGTIGDIGKVSMCKRILKSQTSSQGEIPFYKIGTFGKQPDAYISSEVFEDYKEKYSYPRKGDVLISAAGTLGRTVIFDGEPSYFQDSNIVWIDNDESKVLNSFLHYWYKTSPWKASSGGTISRLYNDNISRAKVPMLPIGKQREIVRILDRFDKLCNDITDGLPAEIEARQKQYEYYRDKLLTFKEKEQ